MIKALQNDEDPDGKDGCQALCRCVVASFKSGEEGTAALKSLKARPRGSPRRGPCPTPAAAAAKPWHPQQLLLAG